jgi:hypothetical protein
MGGRGVTLLFDLLFWLAVAPALFVQTMTMGQGGFRIFMLVTNAMGALLYFLVFSGAILFLLGKILDKILKLVRFILVPIFKIWSKGKKLMKRWRKDFQNLTKHCIVVNESINIRKFMPKRKVGGEQVEAQKGKHIYEAGGVGAGRLRGVQPSRAPRADRARK